MDVLCSLLLSIIDNSQSMHLAYIAQIDCKRSVGNQVEGIYLIVVASCTSMLSLVAFLDVFVRFAFDPAMRLLLP